MIEEILQSVHRHIEILAREKKKKKIPLLFEVVVCICTGRLQMTSVLFKCSRNATPQPLIISLAP